MTFGEKLQELRIAAGLSQDRLAATADVPASTIRNLEQGRREPQWSTLVRLAEALGATLGAFEGCDLKATAPQGRGRPPKFATKPADRPKGGAKKGGRKKG